jgi:hypothetical protein
MKNDDDSNDDNEPLTLSDLLMHALQEKHTPECPFYRGKEDTKVSSGAVSNAYRSGWDTVFGGRVEVGQA